MPLIFYKTHGEFQQTNIDFREISDYTGAFSESLQNRMVLPVDVPPDKLYKLISHELTHIFEYSLFYDGYLGRIFRSNPPGCPQCSRLGKSGTCSAAGSGAAA